MCGGYTLEWLDSLITVSLNPAKTDLNDISPQQLTYLKTRIGQEKIKLQSLLNHKVFSLLEGKKIRILINQYHSALILLLDQTMENKKTLPTNKHTFTQLIKELEACLDELLSFIERRFPNYLNLNKRVPLTYLSEAKTDLKKRLDGLKPRLEQLPDQKVIDIVLQ